MARAIAEKHGMRATFMPKPFAELTGSGCHAHVSLWEGERNLFEDPKAGELGVSGLGYHFLGGLIAHADALCALTNPTVNSYKRINAPPLRRSGATWSPNTVTYGGNNRTHMIRIPDAGRFELRLPDGSRQPLFAAGGAGGGGDGRGGPGEPRSRPAAGHQHVHRRPHCARGRQDGLPLNLLDALRLFDASSVLRQGLGEAFCDAYLKLRHADWNSYAAHLTTWERETTFDT